MKKLLECHVESVKNIPPAFSAEELSYADLKRAVAISKYKDYGYCDHASHLLITMARRKYFRNADFFTSFTSSTFTGKALFLEDNSLFPFPKQQQPRP